MESINPASDVLTDMLKFVCISDTHGLTDPTCIPDGDVLLHAGDFTLRGTWKQVDEFNNFLGQLPHKWKVVIAGNHDICMQSKKKLGPMVYSMLTRHMEAKGYKQCKDMLTNCIYLQDEIVDICGIKIYGSPWSIQYRGYDAFQLPEGDHMKMKWDKIPDDVDILMTHGPPYGICDITKRGLHAGCLDLLSSIQTRIKPKVHVFGHIHEGYGKYNNGVTEFINAAICTVNYRPTNKPFIFYMKIPKQREVTPHCSPVSITSEKREVTLNTKSSYCDTTCDSDLEDSTDATKDLTTFRPVLNDIHGERDLNPYDDICTGLLVTKL
ncbi:metallophosphoesterase domain-containing protein 1 [Mactra antiquata]